MPLYEDIHNAQNMITVSRACKDAVVFGTRQAVTAIVNAINAKGPKANIALDGWYGVDYAALVADLIKTLDRPAEVVNINRAFKSVCDMKAYKQTYVTDDPGFGYVNSDGSLEDLLDDKSISELANKLACNRDKVIIVYNSGATAAPLLDQMDLVFYFDMTMQPMLWKMWDGQLLTFGFDEPDKSYNWKEYYYNDFYLLWRHKKKILRSMDYYCSAIQYSELQLLPKAAYDEIVSTAVQYPIKQVQIFQPGPWGAYRHKDLWRVEGLEISAWNKMSGPELSVLIDFGGQQALNLPLLALMQYNEQVTGSYMAEHYPDLFPLDIWLDDGYFPDKQPAERISMPIHNHPGSDYVKRHFNEPLGRYETYYIAEAYEGANTWLGFTEDCDLEEFEIKCRESNNIVPIANWKDYICNWKSNVGDLYLIPPGTTHAHGGNQMVLEMDTAPSIAGTEYSFFQYDFARSSWDDDNKTMTGKPLKMHLEHAFDNEKWCRSTYVKENLRASPEVIKWTKTYWVDQYASLPEMPFDIERIHFYGRGEYSTSGKFLQIVTLTIGTKVTLVSQTDQSKRTTLERLQCCAVPACFGDYEIYTEDGSFATCVIFHIKKGYSESTLY